MGPNAQCVTIRQFSETIILENHILPIANMLGVVQLFIKIKHDIVEIILSSAGNFIFPVRLFPKKNLFGRKV